jgi:RNA polymerase sigma factor (TIGR02999 family)
MSTPAQDVTRLLHRWYGGDAAAFEALLPLVYEELRRLAHRYLWRERAGHTLRTTDLVHEAFLNLVEEQDTPWQSRLHFFAVAARVMRHVLIDHARHRNRDKRGGGVGHLSLDEVAVFSDDHAEALLALDQALTRLEAFDERACRIVECRYFGGLTLAETAEVLGLSPATIKRDWNLARAWLRHELAPDG